MFIIVAGIHQSCKDDQDAPKTEHNTLVSYEKISSVTSQKIQLGFTVLTLAYPELNGMNFGSPVDADIYRVNYKTSLNNMELIASGIVCIPKSTGAFPILSFQNGTNTSNAKAPSQNLNSEQFVLLENLAGLGYIITIPDYIGFGESNDILHPYYHRQSSDASVINLIKATQEMLEEKAITSSSNGKLFMLGYSQGGWATLSAFQTLETNNTTGLEPIAASCGAGAYNLMEVAKHILSNNMYGSPVYLPYFIESHQRNGLMATNLDLYFNKPYTDTIPALFNGNTYLGTINSALNDTISRLMTPDILQNFATDARFEPLRQELLMNSVDAWQVKGKLLFTHGKSDPVVPPFESENIVAKFRNLGISENQVQLIMLEGKDHGSGLLPWIIKSLVWLDSQKN
jgi:pimeloyl-ACP methyl ester carboxylesterase